MAQVSRFTVSCTGSLLALAPGLVHGQAATAPTDIQQPGTQPQQVAELESPNKCDNCHGGYDQAVEPTFNWRGSMMAQATRDPLFWACMAVAEQDFVGSGDLCLRCHTVEGWSGGRSTPTDGSGLRASDASGVSCDACHQLTNPDDSEHLGVQVPPFLANDEGTPPSGYYGSGMYVLSPSNVKLGPYSDPASPHAAQQSTFHRSSEICGTCHDVSNAAVGDLAHNNGAPMPLAAGTFSGVPGGPVQDKAAFNNFPFQYGVVERTFSEHRASLLSSLRIRDYPSLPEELQDGALEAAYVAALAAGPNGDYADGTPRTFSCQACHMPPVTGKGCNKQNAPVRTDLPLHDLTGGNYWAPEAIEYLDGQGKLILGGGMSAGELAAIDSGALRARTNLENAATLELRGNRLRVINLTGHKLPTGFPEGRRMWLHVRWLDAAGGLVREDGAYGPLTVSIEGTPTQVETLLDLHDPHTRVWEAHFAMTQEWAAQLLGLGYDPGMALSYDRVTGAVEFTLGDLAALPSGAHHETFHFVLNNLVAADNRIPAYGTSYDEAQLRNVLPVPANQFGDPGPAGTYQFWDELTLEPPRGAHGALIELLYQPTSWEYIQFLALHNDGSVAFLADTGDDLLEAWLATGMAEPAVLASVRWARPPYSDAVPVRR